MVGKTMYGTIRGNGGRNTKSTAACAWRTEYEKYCRLRDLPMDDDTALRFLDMKQEEIETALANGDA